MTDIKTAAFFSGDGEWLVGGDGARSPWQEDACHGGPVTAVAAGALEAVVTDKQLIRLSIVFTRPVPLDGFRLASSLTKNGRTVSLSRTEFYDRQDRQVAFADGVHIQTADAAGLPTAEVAAPEFSAAARAEFFARTVMHDKPYFGHSIDVASDPVNGAEHGPRLLWMRTPPIIDGEAPTAFQTACPISDCGNGISRNTDFDRARFINPDLTVALHRLPRSRWLASQARSHWQPNGVGLSEAVLYDREGVIGMALQTLLIRKV